VSKNSLKQHRATIDKIDVAMLNLLNQRASYAQKIGEIKGEADLIYRPEREAQVLRRLKGLNLGPLPGESVLRLFREIMSECLALEKQLSIGYLGPQGSCSQRATLNHFGRAASTVACSSIEDAFRLAESRDLDYVVAPIAQPTEIATNRTVSIIVNSPLKICGEIRLRIKNYLLRKVAHFDRIRYIYARAETLAHCHQWLNEILPPEVERVSMDSNAAAARRAATDESAVAIACHSEAKRHALLRLASNISSAPRSTTQFLVFGLQEVGVSGQDKTMVIVSTPHDQGTADQLLPSLPESSVSVRTGELRLSSNSLSEYAFLIEMEGHQHDITVRNALMCLSERFSFIKVLGSYPISECIDVNV
jgi:chorismate mutase / prephenate dehydratase